MHSRNLLPDIPELFEGLVIGHRVDEQKTVSRVHEGLSQGAVLLLSRRIQNLYLQGLAINVGGSQVGFLHGGIILET